jgi:glycosyltransferase involved in cell wall biosynthesis
MRQAADWVRRKYGGGDAPAMVSIVIPFYDCRYIDQAVQSALNQTYENVEVVVVNDGSSRFTDLIDPFRDRIRYIEKENGGTASALNAGIRAARGEYFAWLSADDLYYPERLSRQIAFMKKRRVSASFSNFDFIDAAGVVTGRSVGLASMKTADLYRHFASGHCPVNGCSVLIRRDNFDKVGLFDETLRFTQDWDMWMRLLLAGHEFPYMDESLLMYRVHDEMASKIYESQLAPEIEMTRLKYSRRLLDYVSENEPAGTL